MTVQIKEGDQLVFRGSIEDAPQTDFIQSLIAAAVRDGVAEREDNDGCMVTCVAFSE